MDYQAHYDKLIARGQRTLIHGYRERHHIIPKCMGGTNRQNNMVYLTAEEHFIAHKLLAKIHPNNKKLLFAIEAMCRHNGNGRINNKIHGKLKELCREARKEQGIHIKFTNKGNKHTDEWKENMRLLNTGRKMLPEDIQKLSIAKQGKRSKRIYTALSQETKDKISKSKRKSK